MAKSAPIRNIIVIHDSLNGDFYSIKREEIRQYVSVKLAAFKRKIPPQ